MIAAALIGKATVALAAPQQFYATRRGQYNTQHLPRKLLAGPVFIGLLASISWYATIYHYRSAGWLVTVFLTVVLCIAFDHLFRWNKHRQRMLRVLSASNLWLFDCVLLLIGTMFALLAFLVY